MVLKEDLEQLLVADLAGVVAHLHGLGVTGASAAHFLVSGIWCKAARIADRRVSDSRCLPEQLFGSPKATKGEVGDLRALRHLLHRDAKDVVEGGIDQD